jgi:hypothetical protein
MGAAIVRCHDLDVLHHSPTIAVFAFETCIG